MKGGYMKVNRRLNRFIRKNMWVYEHNGKRCLLINRHIFVWNLFYAMWLSNEHLRRYSK